MCAPHASRTHNPFIKPLFHRIVRQHSSAASAFKRIGTGDQPIVHFITRFHVAQSRHVDSPLLLDWIDTIILQHNVGIVDSIMLRRDIILVL